MRPISRTIWSLVSATAIAAVGVVTLQPHAAPAASSAPAARIAAGLASSTVPTPAHVVVVMEENHSYTDIIGDTTDAPYINSLAVPGRADDLLVRGHPPERAQLHGAVLRQHRRPDRRHLPGQREHHRQPRLRAARRRRHLQGLLRGPAEDRLDHLHLGQLRPQALAVDQLQRDPHLGLAAVHLLPELLELRQPADAVVRDPEPQRRHAQRHHRPGRHLAEDQHVRLRDLGQGQQQPADRHLGRGRLHREQPGPDDLRRPVGRSPASTTRRSTTTTCWPRWSRCTASPRSARAPRATPITDIWN